MIENNGDFLVWMERQSKRAADASTLCCGPAERVADYGVSRSCCVWLLALARVKTLLHGDVRRLAQQTQHAVFVATIVANHPSTMPVDNSVGILRAMPPKPRRC
jgi:hypothetical protein